MNKQETHNQAISNINSCLITADLKALKKELQVLKDVVSNDHYNEITKTYMLRMKYLTTTSKYVIFKDVLNVSGTIKEYDDMVILQIKGNWEAQYKELKELSLLVGVNYEDVISDNGFSRVYFNK